MQLHQQCSHNQDICKRYKEHPTVAACVYEKGPQTLADAISEVDKLQSSTAIDCHPVTLIYS